MPSSTAKPLNTPAKPQGDSDLRDKTPTPANAVLKKPTAVSAEISSPHELTAFVETLLEDLENKFDEMSSQILERMGQMSSRVDALEASIQDIINGDIASTGSIPVSPGPGTPGIRKSGSGL